VGAIGDIAGRPGVHAHCLFFFEVDAIEAARATGRVVLDPLVLPNGKRICVCDNPQGAAFALRERRSFWVTQVVQSMRTSTTSSSITGTNAQGSC
jgi:hypothetical protein